MINISIAFTDDYSLPANVLIASILKSSRNDDEFTFHILDEGLLDSTKNTLFRLKKIKDFEVNFVDINVSDFVNFPLPKTGHFRLVNYYRIKIPSLLPQLSKVLYLDCDVIVQNSLKSLFDLDISSFHLGAAKSVTSYKNNRRLGIPKFIPYINSGVMLINAEKWRSENIESKLVHYISTAPQEKLINVDQDAINAVLYGSIYHIDRRWNVEIRNDVTYPIYYTEFLNDPFVLHYASSDKPWLEGTKHDTSIFNFYKGIIYDLS